MAPYFVPGLVGTFTCDSEVLFTLTCRWWDGEVLFTLTYRWWDSEGLFNLTCQWWNSGVLFTLTCWWWDSKLLFTLTCRWWGSHASWTIDFSLFNLRWRPLGGYWRICSSNVPQLCMRHLQRYALTFTLCCLCIISSDEWRKVDITRTYINITSQNIKSDFWDSLWQFYRYIRASVRLEKKYDLQ